MKVRNNGRKRAAFILLLLVWLLWRMPFTVYATEVNEDLTNEVDESNNNRFSADSPWLDQADDSIYSNPIDAGEEDSTIEPSEPGSVEKYLSELIRNASSSLISLLEDNLGASIDRIIYGRVGSGSPNSVNIFGFEMRSGNPYGVTASVCYAVVRSMAFVFLGVKFVFILAKSAWTGQTGQSREKIKSSIFDTAVKFVMLTLMPYLFDLGIYVRDVILYGIKNVTGIMITNGATLSLSNAFLINAERTGRFVDAIMYLGTVILTLYFAFIYVALAIDLLICFVSFPIMLFVHSPKKDLFNNWLMNVLSDLLTPVLDAILLLVPLLTSLMLSDVVKGIAIIQLIMCMLIIPSRNRIKMLLGIQSNERMGLLGAMAMLSLGRGIAGRIKGAFGKAKEIRSDLDKSKMHEELGEVDEKENQNLLGGYSGNDEGKAGLSDDPLDKDGDIGEENGLEDGEMGDDSQSGLEDSEEGLTDSLDEEGALGEDMTETGMNSQGAAASTEEGGAIDGSEQPLTRNEALRRMESEMDKKQKQIDGLREQKAQYQTEEKQKSREMLNHDRDSDEYRALEKQRANASLKAAETERKIAAHTKDLNQLRSEAKTMRGSVKGATPTTFDEERADIICKRANINNFESPEFKGHLSHERMAELYKQRAMTNVAKGAGAVVGAGAGAVMLGGASVFMGPSTTMMATAAGALGGASIGSAAVDVGIGSARMVGNIAQEGVNLYQGMVQQEVAGVASSIDFETAYENAPIAPGQAPPVAVVPTNPTVPHNVGTVQVPNVQQPIMSDEVLRQQMMVQIEQDSARAMKRIISPSGGMKNSVAIRALQQANVETEKYIASVRETQGVELSQSQVRAKRVELQTSYMTEEVMKKLSVQPEYEKGTERYAQARESVAEKVRVIIEKQNKSIF